MGKSLVLIDGVNCYAATKALGFDLDFKRLREWVQKRGPVKRLCYFTTTREGPDGHNTLRPLLDFLDYNGFEVITKPLKEFIDSDGSRKKGSMMVEIAVKTMRLTTAGDIDEVVLFSGDGDLVELVRDLMRDGINVTVISTLETTPPIVSDELRRAANQFFDLMRIADEIKSATTRPPRPRRD